LTDAAPRSRSRTVALALLGVGAVALAGFAVFEWATWPDVAALARKPPEHTAFIDAYRAERRAAGEDDRVAWRWVEWNDISVDLKRAVVCGEDLEFFSHHGFSKSEMEVALRQALAGERFRGASTITQQLAKNLWLSPSRNPWRKVKEALLTRSLEHHLTKQRILLLYLNVVEFGHGVYGAEAAAERYFDKPAAGLDESESAMLAASLPRPSSWHPGVSSRAYARYVADVEERMQRATFLWRVLGATPPLPIPLPADSLQIPAPDSVVDSLPAPDTIAHDTLPVER
jgi:monofunctional biosynthetic peptidoglycan transglycosylase